MKKKTQSKSISQDFKMPHLFREDLEELESVIKEMPKREYKLESESFEYNTVSEIPKDSDVVNEFHVQVYSPSYMSVDFNCDSASIYASNNDIKTLGAVYKMIEIILRRERKFLYWSAKLSTWLGPLLFYAAIKIFFLMLSKDEKNLGFHNSRILSIAFLSIIAVVWWVIGYYSSSKKFSIIEFAYKKERLNFFVRNKDQIILITIGSLLGALATILFQKIFS